MAAAVETAIQNVWPVERWSGTTIVVGVSGGPDSVALLRALSRLADASSTRLVVAHFNHGWRGDSSADARFVEELSRQLGLPFELGVADSDRPIPGMGREDSARRRRFAFFEAIGKSLGARYLALGHTRDDHVETILHRILRGTGPAGLAGIPLFRPWFDGAAVVHPMREVGREDVLRYLFTLNQPYCEDPSNCDDTLTRNHIRRDLLPKLRAEYNPRVDDALARLGTWASEFMEWLPQLLEPLITSAVVAQRPDHVRLDTACLAGLPSAVLVEFIRLLWRRQNWPQGAMSYDHWLRLAEMIGSGTERRMAFPGGVNAEREGTQFVIRRISPDAPE